MLREKRLRRLSSAFTLIEILAVVLIMGLAMSVVLPNLSSRQTSALKDQALGVAAQLELARQLAVVTGTPHRMLIDIETGAYRLEWFGELSEAEDIEGSEEKINLYPSVYQEVDLSPPSDDNVAYHPIDGRFGHDSLLDRDFFFEGLETAEGWFDSGEVMLVFDRDGTTDAAELVIADDYDNAYVLEVRPLLDTVRIFQDEG